MTRRVTGRCSCRLRGPGIALLAVFAIASSTARAACTDPSYAKLKPPVYPPSAVSAKTEGRALIEVTVSVEGVPHDFIVRQSSGSAELDRAALDAVSEWRFNPALCNGKATPAKAIVPFDFNLREDEAAQGSAPAPPGENRPIAGRAVAGKDNRELAADQEPMGAASAAELLRRLEKDETVMRLRSRRIDASTTLSRFLAPEDVATFDVIQSTEHGWSVASGGGWASIIRTRYLTVGHVTRELYAQLCDGDSGWCELQLASYLQVMREDPPPLPPPPPPRRSAPAERGSH